jgi:hypothetical protein
MYNIMKTIKIFFITVSLLIANCSFSMAQCAMCRATVESNLSSGRGEIGLGINGGILILLVMPYLSVAAVFFFWYRNAKMNIAKKNELQNRLREILV